MNPGFVESNMTVEGREYMPFLVPTDRACSIIVDGIRKNDAEVIFPFPLAALTFAARCVPLPIRTFVFATVMSCISKSKKQ